MFKFMLIPSTGDAVTSLLPYRDADEALAIGETVARRVLSRAATLTRPSLLRLAQTNPDRLELVVMNAQTRESVFPARMIERQATS